MSLRRATSSVRALRAALAAIVGLLVSTAAPASVATAGPPPPGADCPVRTADLRILRATVGEPAELSVTLALDPRCDERADDPRTAEVSWGDGATSTATVTPASASEAGWPTIAVAATHVYAVTPPLDVRSGRRGFPIVVTVTNGRTGRAIVDDRYVATVAEDRWKAADCRAPKPHGASKGRAGKRRTPADRPRGGAGRR